MAEYFGFTEVAELLNCRLAALGFVLGVVTELLTGVGPVGQLLSLWKSVVNLF